MPSRTRKQAPAPASWSDVDALVGEMARYEAAAAVIQADADEQVRALRAEAAAAQASLKERADGLRRQVEAFAKSHRRDFGDARSRTLAHGRLGWRQSESLRFVADAADIVADLEKRGLDVAVMVTKRASKDVLATFPDTLLVELGVRRILKDLFFVEYAEAGPCQS